MEVSAKAGRQHTARLAPRADDETNELSQALVSIAELRGKCWPPLSVAETEALVGRVRRALRVKV